jgi:predicted DNA-binding transcriptional regulator YafY
MLRAERIQLILSLLRSSPGMRPGDLAVRCRVSKRSIFRDLQTLQTMGLPLYFDRGYQLPSPAILPAFYLTGEEALALRVAAGRSAELEGPMAQALLSAQCKLALRLSSASPTLERQMPLTLPGITSPLTEAIQILSLVQEAVATGRKLRLRYTKRDGGRPTSIELIPQHLSLRENGWMLLGDNVATRRRVTIRLDQIRSAIYSERKGGRIRPARRTTGVTVPATALRVTLRLRPPLTALCDHGDLPFGIHIDERDGGVFGLTSHTSGAEELLGWLLSFGPTVEVLEPMVLRMELRRMVADLAVLYGDEQ